MPTLYHGDWTEKPWGALNCQDKKKKERKICLNLWKGQKYETFIETEHMNKLEKKLRCWLASV